MVAGLKKIACTNMKEAIMVLEAGLHERQVAGTGSNSVSSRSHGFFCVEVKKRAKVGRNRAWAGSNLTIVDLAGSERARDAKTQGATLAEAGKINESLMYLGQCLQAQSGMGNSSKVLCLVEMLNEES
ncbi:kinesin-like protein [Colletotrichum higginsianum]|nr:kinesin-like protein [Colletotrichum higginsianum]